MKLIKTLVSGQPLTPGQMEDVEGGLSSNINLALDCDCAGRGTNANMAEDCTCKNGLTPPTGWQINTTAKCVIPGG